MSETATSESADPASESPIDAPESSEQVNSGSTQENNMPLPENGDSDLEIVTAVSSNLLLTFVPPQSEPSPADSNDWHESPVAESEPTDPPAIDSDEPTSINAGPGTEEQILDALRQADERFEADLAQFSVAESTDIEYENSSVDIDNTESGGAISDFTDEMSESREVSRKSDAARTKSNTPSRRNSRSRGRSPMRGDPSLLEPEVTTARCQEKLREFQRYSTVPDFYERDSILRYIQRSGIDAIVSHNYQEAENMHRVYAQFLHGMVVDDKVEFSNTRDSLMATKLENAKSEIATRREQWQSRLDELTDVTSSKLAQLKAVHKRQLAAFEAHFDEIESLRGFSKPSEVLVRLRTQERAMVLCNRFKEARAIQKEASVRERTEKQRCQRRAEASVLQKRANLVAKQAREFETATEFYDRLLTTTRVHMARAMEIGKSRLEFLERESRAFFIPYISDLDGTGDPPGFASPRTKDKVYAFRQTEPLKPLTLVPLTGLKKKCSKSLPSGPVSRAVSRPVSRLSSLK
jgi:hypothetical protein